MSTAGEEVSLSRIVRRLVNADPCVRECLARGLVNYSELARRIAASITQQTGTPPNPDSIKVALIRYSKKLRREPEPVPQRKLLEILARSALELRTGISVATVRLTALPRLAEAAGEVIGRARLFFLLQSLTSVTVIASDELFDRIVERVGRENFIRVYRDQTVLIIVSPEDVVGTPGFIAYIANILAENGVNINQIESVYTDTLLVMDTAEALRAFQLLREALEVAKRGVAEARGEVGGYHRGT